MRSGASSVSASTTERRAMISGTLPLAGRSSAASSRPLVSDT